MDRRLHAPYLCSGPDVPARTGWPVSRSQTLTSWLPVAASAYAVTAPGSISGTVYAADGTTPLEGVWVSASGDFGVGGAYTGPDGTYTIAGLANGTLRPSRASSTATAAPSGMPL